MTAAEMLSIAAFHEGRHAQAFPSFGSERTGAPVVAFCRVDDKPIRLREPVMEPDALIVQDPTLLLQVDVFQGLSPAGYVLINSSRSFAQLGLGELIGRLRADRVLTVPATELALKYLRRPLPNAVLLGGFAAISSEISLAAVVVSIRAKFKGAVADANAAAAQAAFDFVRREREELSHA